MRVRPTDDSPDCSMEASTHPSSANAPDGAFIVSPVHQARRAEARIANARRRAQHDAAVSCVVVADSGPRLPLDQPTAPQFHRVLMALLQAGNIGSSAKHHDKDGGGRSKPDERTLHALWPVVERCNLAEVLSSPPGSRLGDSAFERTGSTGCQSGRLPSHKGERPFLEARHLPAGFLPGYSRRLRTGSSPRRCSVRRGLRRRRKKPVQGQPVFLSDSFRGQLISLIRLHCYVLYQSH